MKKLKLKLTALAFISIILLSGYTPLLSNHINKLNLNPKQSISLGNQYLYLDDVTQTPYDFRAQGACYILVEIEGTDFTYFMLDEEIYEVSYGFNIFPVKFSNNPYKTYTIEIALENRQYFKSLTVEPLFIAEDEIEVNLIQDTAINFQVGGPISILTRINFSYNWLRVELKNETGDSTILKRIHNTTDYPEIDPLFYCLFMERGTYIRYDVNLKPGEYTLLFQGNGSIEYKIMVNSDWDGDMFKDVDEIQQEDMYEFNLDPTHPDIWGFFEKSEENLLNTSIEEGGFTEGYFSFYIPDIYINNDLTIRVNSGTFKEVEVDMDSLFFEGEIFNSNRETPSSLHMYGRIDPGWHHISYLHKANYTSDIEFLITNNMGLLQEIKIIQIAEFRDTDGDGIKDLEEYSNSLNPAKTDTDEDGLPDNMDGSPLAKLVLDPNQIHQMVLSVNNSKDTLINIQIKKPENDYSTNGVPRLWRGAVNVSIYPVLRLFGNKFNNSFDSLIYNLDKPALEWLWGKGFNCVFKSDKAILANYNENGIGDSLPNPNDPDSEFFFIFPKPALEVIDYDIMIPKGHSSKDDGLLDLRFDFIWVITEYDYDTGETLVLHYYDFEEPIIVQSMAMREISSIHYTLGNPDCFIENQILWTLTQNPSLGSFGDFGVDDDVELSGTIDYFGLPEIISEYRLNVGYKVNESEVLYMKGFYQNHDILNQIYVRTLVNPDFETLNQGNYSVCFSSYSISNLYENQSYVYGDSEIQGETEILYQLYSSENDQQKKIVMGVPIAMERSVSSHTLEISQIQGILDTLEEIPWDGSQLSDTMTVLHQTYIERDVQAMGIPLVHFEEGIDVYKEYMDNRQDEVELSHQFFTAQPEMPAEFFMNYIEVLWEQIALMKENLIVLYDYVKDNPDFFVPGADREDLTLMKNMINVFTEFQQHSYSEMSSYTDFFQFYQNFNIDVIHLVDLYQGKESNNLVKADFFMKLSNFMNVFKPVVLKVGALFSRSDEIVNNKGVTDTPKQNIESKNAKNPSAEAQKVKTHKMSRVIGAGCAILGLVMVGFSIYEIYMIASGNKTAYQGIKALKAICNLVASFLLFMEGTLLFASSFAKTSASALKSASKSMGKFTLIISIIMFGLDLYKFLDRVIAGEEVDLFMEIFSLAMSAALITVGIVVAAGFCSTGVGALIGGIIAAVTVLVSWVTKYVNAPDLEFVENDCRTYYPNSTILNMRRNGGLEDGDQFVYHLKVKNTGRNRVWMRARMKMAGDTLTGVWTSYVGDWANGKNKGGYKKNQIFEHDLIASIDGATPNLKYVLEFEADYRHWYLFIPVRKDLTDEEWNVPMNTHALETSISDFYSHTSDYGSINDLKREYEEALEEYRYWDASNIGETIIKAAEVNAGIKLSHFKFIEASSSLDRAIELGDWDRGLGYHARDLGEWEYLLNNFYTPLGDSGWAAWDRPDDPTYERSGSPIFYSNTAPQPDTFYWNMMSYDVSGGWLYTMLYSFTPNVEPWMEKKNAELADAFEYRELVDNLPIKSNLSTDLRKQHIEVDPVTGIAEVSLNMIIEPYYNPYYYIEEYLLTGSDGYKTVDFHITAPEGYSISPQNVFTKYLDSTISFNLTTDTPKFGLYFFNVSIFFEGELIYKESVPFKVGGFSCMEFETYTATEPLVPGQLFTMIDLHNLGTFTEVANITVEGIPECFIYRELYPDNFINGSLLLALNPGDIIPGLIINPPRHHSTAPGIYSYTFRAQDHIFTNYDEIIHGTFEVAEFYDMNFTCAEPEITIFDFQKGEYTFNLTNLGNVGQQFNITLDDIPFAEESLSIESIYLGPGESQSFTLHLTPMGWGQQTFSIYATSEYNSSLVNVNITIVDDDINQPEFTNFDILNTSLDVTVIFEVLNELEGDDTGLSNIKIFIDNELVLNYAPSATETNFSFTFDSSHGEWFMQNGTHVIKVEIIDNDFDVPFDSLNSSISGTFEITLINMFYYVDWQLEVLREYIDNNIDSCLGWIWNKKLCWAQCQMKIALEYVINGNITCSLFHDAVAKALVQIVNFRAEFFEKFNCIDNHYAEFIINSTRIIRNNIVLIMGFTTNTNIGFKIALVEIDLLNLNDFIEEEIDWWKRWCLQNHIRSATYILEAALIKISLGCNIECCLSHALYKLEKAECKVHWLVCKGWITQELADTILFKLNQAQEDLQAILNAIQPSVL